MSDSPAAKSVPQSILAAQQALKLLAQEDAAAAEALKSKLPGFAMGLERAGEDVTVESLLDHARMGAEHMLSYKPSQKDNTPSYFEIVERNKGKAFIADMKIMHAIVAEDHDEIVRLLKEGADPLSALNFSLRYKDRDNCATTIINTGFKVGQEALLKFLNIGLYSTNLIPTMIAHNIDIPLNDDIVLQLLKSCQIDALDCLLTSSKNFVVSQQLVDKALRDRMNFESGSLIPTLKILVKHGADINACNPPVLSTLMARGVTINGTMAGRFYTPVKSILELGADPTANDNAAIKTLNDENTKRRFKTDREVQGVFI